MLHFLTGGIPADRGCPIGRKAVVKKWTLAFLKALGNKNYRFALWSIIGIFRATWVIRREFRMIRRSLTFSSITAHFLHFKPLLLVYQFYVRCMVPKSDSGGLMKVVFFFRRFSNLDLPKSRWVFLCYFANFQSNMVAKNASGLDYSTPGCSAVTSP